MINEPAIWVLFVTCLVLSFVMSGMEAGVFALSRLRIRQLVRSGAHSARVLHGYLENPENFLWTILVGNTVANFLILGWMLVVLNTLLSGRRIWILASFALLVLVFFALFDLLPKMLFRMYPNRLCLWLAQPFRVVHLALRPLVSLVEWFSGRLLKWRGGEAFTGRLFGNRDELRWVMQESAQGFSTEERAMINRVLDLQSLTARQAMKPLTEAKSISAQAPVSEALAMCREKKLSRLPVWDTRDSQKRVVGLVSLNTLLFQPGLDGTRPVMDFMAPALFLEEDSRLEVALRRMQRSGQRLAIVLGRDQKETGILTLQDVLAFIFGEVSL